jgi:hypothetical protein
VMRCGGDSVLTGLLSLSAAASDVNSTQVRRCN